MEDGPNMPADPNPFIVAFDRANALLTLGRIDDALHIAESLVAEFPDSSAVYLLKAQCLLEQGRDGAAEQCSAAATALAPDDPECAVIAVRCAWDWPDKGRLWSQIGRAHV